MSNVLQNLFRGEINPFSQYFSRLQLQQNSGEYQKQKEAFLEKLPEELHGPFHQLMDLKNDDLLGQDEEAFEEGFCLGVRMILNVLLKEES